MRTRRSDVERAAQADVLGRGADQDVEAPGLDGPPHVAIEQHHVVVPDREAHALLFARLKRHALEPAQHLVVVHDARDPRRQIELHDLVAGSPAGVLHVQRDLHGAARRLLGRRDLEVRVTVGRVTETIPERVQRSIDHRLFFLRLELFGPRLRPALEREVVGNLADGLGERDRQLAGRIVVAEQDVGDRAAAELALEPRFDDRRCVAIDPVDRERPAVQQDDDHRLARVVDRLRELQLEAGEIQAGPRTALADQLLVLAEDDDGGVHLARQIARLVELGALLRVRRHRDDLAVRERRVDELAALRVEDVRAGPHLRANAVEHRHNRQIRGPVAADRIAGLGRVGAGDQNRLEILAKRQGGAIVLEQHDRFPRGALRHLEVLRIPHDVVGRLRIRRRTADRTDPPRISRAGRRARGRQPWRSAVDSS